MLGGNVALVGPALFSPPGVAQHIGHRNEVINRFAARGSRKKKAEQVHRPIRQYVHKKQRCCKIKGRKLCIQRFQQTRPHVEAIAQLLTALD